MKIAIITDLHIGARGDSQIFSRYFARFYNETFFPKIDELGIDTVICMGDTFDRRKYINYVSLRAGKDMLFDPMKERNIDAHFIIGNHDVTYRDTNSINSGELLLDDYPNIKVYPNPTTVSIGDIDICLLPWINSENYADTMTEIKNTKAQVCMGHLEIAGFRMYKGSFNDGGLDTKIFEQFDMTFSGHYHHKSSVGDIHYLGNPYAITWADYDDHRGFHIFDTETRELEFIKNPLDIFHKVWYNDEDKSLEKILDIDFTKYTNTYVKLIVTKKTNPYYFDRFLDELYKADAQNIQIVDDHFHQDELSEDDIMKDLDDTLTILKKTVDSLEMDTDTKPLKELMETLYIESLNYEGV
jgi:DNA repair exonuclease SbcCD nuclease subunit